MTAGAPGPRPDDPARLSRRAFGLGAAAVLVGGAVLGTRWFNLGATANADGVLSAPEAHAGALNGSVLLIDIRRPDEWRRTGVAEAAIPLDMRRADFTDALLSHAGGDKGRTIALICARGVRSRNLARTLRDAGYPRVVDVSEGMMGSGAGPGWLKRGLPVVAGDS